MLTFLFRSRAPGWIRRSGRRARRRAATLRATRLGSWETLGLGLGGEEMLERRSMMAADLVLSFDDNIAAAVSKDFYSPGSQVVYRLAVENKGDATATDAAVTTALSGKIDPAKVSWFASYSGGATGAGVGTRDVNTAVTLPAGGRVVFTITGSVKADATGDLVSKADVAVVPGSSNSKTDTNTFVPRSLLVSAAPGFAAAGGRVGAGQISLANPTTGAVVAPAVNAFRGDVRTGVRAAFADLDGNGRNEVVAVPGYGQAARIAVFQQVVAADGKVTLVRDARYDLLPFGPGYNRGLSLAVGDFDADGRTDIAVAKSVGDGAVRVYRSTPASASQPLSLLASFTPFPGGQGGATIAAGDFGTFSGGVRVDAGRNDGKAEIAVASGIAAAPVVKVYSVAQGTAELVRTVTAFTPSFRGGMDIATGRVNADSIPEIILAQGPGGSSQVQVINGRVDSSKAAVTLARYSAFADLATRAAPLSITGIGTDEGGRTTTIAVGQYGGNGAGVRRLDATTGKVAGTLGSLAGNLQIAAASSRYDNASFTTASGLQITRLSAPTGGTSPTDSTKKVTVDYIGYLAKDGTVFDDGKGKSQTFDLKRPDGSPGLILGWIETLKLMKAGEVVRVAIPAKLGYGATGSPPTIPPNADLVFVIRLVSFE